MKDPKPSRPRPKTRAKIAAIPGPGVAVAIKYIMENKTRPCSSTDHLQAIGFDISVVIVRTVTVAEKCEDD
jgi:hypothetical protein